MWSRFAALVSAFLCLACAPAFATTYYVSPHGSDFSFGTSPVFPWASLARVNSADLRSGDQIFFLRGGTWRGTLQPQAAGLYYGAYGSGSRPAISGADLMTGGLFPFWLPAGENAWITSSPAIPTQLWFDGVLGTQVSSQARVRAPLQWFYSEGELTVFSKSYPSLQYKAPGIEAATHGEALLLKNVRGVTVEHIAFINSADAAACLCAGTSGVATFNDDVFSGALNNGIAQLSGTVALNQSEVTNNGVGVTLDGGDGFSVNASLFSGNHQQAIVVSRSTGPSSIAGSTISGNATSNAAVYVVSNTSGWPLIVTGSVLLPNPFQPKFYSFSGMTDSGNNVYQSPYLARRAAPLVVVPFIDDYNNLSVAQAVAKLAQSYGCTLSYALNTKLVTPAAWQQIAALQSSGVEIVAHSRSHSDLANNNVFTIQYTGKAATATMTVDQTSGRLRTYLNGATTPDLDLNITDTYNAIVSVLSSIPAGSPYTVAIQPNQNYFTPLNLAGVVRVDIKTKPYMAVASSNYLTWEVEGAKADIAANLPGVPVKAFATPFTSSNVGVEDHIRDAGFSSNRNGILTAASLPEGNWLLSRPLDVYNMASEWLPFSYDATNPSSSAGALVEGLGAQGGVMAVYSHGYDEFSLGNWADLFATLKQVGGTCMTMSQANAVIESQGSLIPDGTAKNWIQVVPLRPDYSVTSASPIQGARTLQ